MNSYLLITGATGGLGSAFAQECAQRGYALYLTDWSDAGQSFADYLRQTYGVEVRFRACDLTSAQQRQVLYQAFKEEGIRFWGLINVAGMDYEGAFLERTRQQILTILQLNMEATVDNSHAILHLRDPEQRFVLINVCSLAAYYPMPYKALYAASKRFLLDFSQALREEITPYGTVTALCPAGLPTTPETMRAIFAQGFWGMATTMDTRVVARRTIQHALRGKAVYIPGWFNRILRSLGSMAPAWLVAKFVGRRWSAAQLEQKAGWKPHQAIHSST